MPADINKTINAVWRIESAKLIAGLMRITRDVGAAEELAQDALVAALEQWPRDGVPENPGAWLMQTAKHRAVDSVRRRQRFTEKTDDVSRELEAAHQERAPDLIEKLDDHVGDDLLRLMLVSCHPLLPSEARVALTLRLLGGLTTDEIARAFLVPEPTVAQRIVRAKKTLSDAGVAFEVPRGDELEGRVASVLEVLYLVFNEGYSATAGGDWMRPALCEDALRLGRVLAGLQPKDPEVHALVALMELQASRTHARTGPEGEPVLLLEQNRGKWDQLAIRRGLQALQKALELQRARGPYLLQAEIAACHARARTADETDWRRIAQTYTELVTLIPSPVIELNRAVAVSMAFGPDAGLKLVDQLREAKALKQYHLLPAVRGDLLSKLGRHDDARDAFLAAAELTQNERERALLLRRADALTTRH